MFTFNDALLYATEAHRGKKDKGGIDYIKHPLYIHHKIRARGGSNEAQMTAILHDVIEDSDVTIENLVCSGCPESVIEALKLLTHKVDENLISRRIINEYKLLPVKEAEIRATEDEYLTYIQELSKNDIARMVKIEDLRHNSDIRRLKFTEHINEKDILRIIKYCKALSLLTGGKVGYV